MGFAPAAGDAAYDRTRPVGSAVVGARPRRIVRGAVLTVLLLGTVPGCDGGEPAGSSEGAPPRGVDRSQAPEAAEEEPAPAVPQPCPSRSGTGLTIDDEASHELAWGSVGDLAVGPRGTATLALESGSRTSRGWQVQSASLPPSPGDPQTLPGPPPDVLPAGARVSALFPIGDHLEVDGSGALTAAFHQDLRLASGQTTENYDLALSDRAIGGSWSSKPQVLDEGGIGNTELAVSPSGAAVVAWDRYDRGAFRAYVSYRPTSGAAWSPAAPVAPRAASLWDAGIDAKGRAVLLYSTPAEDAMAVRGTPTAGWSRPHPLPGQARTLAVGSGGAAVVAGTRGAMGRRAYTVGMSSSGSWREPVEQPGEGLYPDRPVAMDGAGRALYVWWEDRDLLTRWSRPGGRWHAPCVLASDVPDPRYFDDVDSHVAVNSRGDALVMWRTRDGAPQLWARYMPAGQRWGDPIAVTPGDGGLLGEFVAALGSRGHVAMAWTTGDQRQIHLVRHSPAR